MSWLLNLYPKAWQKRFRAEVEELLKEEPVRLRTAFDLVAGAVDAWLNPKWIPQVTETAETGEKQNMITASRCGTTDISIAEAKRSALLMLGVTFVLTAIGVALDKTFGDHFAIQALINASFFIALTISSWGTYLKPYSKSARKVIIGVSTVGWYAFFFAVGALTAFN